MYKKLVRPCIKYSSHAWVVSMNTAITFFCLKTSPQCCFPFYHLSANCCPELANCLHPPLPRASRTNSLFTAHLYTLQIHYTRMGNAKGFFFILSSLSLVNSVTVSFHLYFFLPATWTFSRGVYEHRFNITVIFFLLHFALHGQYTVTFYELFFNHLLITISIFFFVFIICRLDYHSIKDGSNYFFWFFFAGLPKTQLENYSAII